jgi:hypothetical protein
MKLNPKQLSYIKGLDSKKKQRKFLLDCILENVIGESKEIKVEKVTDEKLTGTGYENAFFKVRIPIGADFSDVLKEVDKYKESQEIALNYSEPKKEVEEKVDLSKELYLTYIGTDCNSFCVRVLDFENLRVFTMTKFRFEESNYWSWKLEPRNWRKSTPEEIKSMLIKKLEADGLKVGCSVNRYWFDSESHRIRPINELSYYYDADSDVLECYSRKVYEKGKFATIIPQENNELVNLTDEIKNIEVDFENVSQKENN